MDVLVPDAASVTGGLIAGELALRGHKVLSCKRPGQSSSCAVLDDRSCPLETEAVDVVVGMGGPGAPWERGDGATCAVTHRVPLVLVDAELSDPLVEFAAATTTQSGVVSTVEQVAAAPLAVHSVIAHKTAREELERTGSETSTVAVEVRRRSGRLVVELWYGHDMDRSQAERLATHVVQAVREYDSSAAGVDVLVRDLSGEEA